MRYVRNPNGALDDIAGVCNEGRNVVGLMPHPERASDRLLGSDDGLVMLRSLLASVSAVRDEHLVSLRATPVRAGRGLTGVCDPRG